MKANCIGVKSKIYDTALCSNDDVMNKEMCLIKLSELFNHSDVSITKRYLGLKQEEILDTYDYLTF